MAQTQTSASGSYNLDNEMDNQPAHHDAKDPTENVKHRDSDDASEEPMQEGVKQAEALTMSWTKKSLGLAYAL